MSGTAHHPDADHLRHSDSIMTMSRMRGTVGTFPIPVLAQGHLRTGLSNLPTTHSPERTRSTAIWMTGRFIDLFNIVSYPAISMTLSADFVGHAADAIEGRDDAQNRVSDQISNRKIGHFMARQQHASPS